MNIIGRISSKSKTFFSFLRNMNISTAKNVKIKLNQGSIAGLQDALPNGKPYYYFKGIPYAQPPIGNLRFKDPVPLEKFPQDVLDCTKERDICFQKNMLTAEYSGSEDCLFLNVYTPSFTSKRALPVMVWIHGGAFMTGSGDSEYYSPEYLVQNDVIVVTCNYRLGPFGFLCLPEAGIHGNAGIKDQVLVLKWVNENISKFGGDAKNVTLFGESAGGSSVFMHILSSCSKQYFHKAICQSGTSTMEWAVQRNPVEKSIKLAKSLGLESDSQPEIFDFLKTQDTKDIHKKMISTLSSDEKRRDLPIPFKPCIEEDWPGAFITKSEIELLNEPNTITIPLMLGYNDAEGLMLLEGASRKLDVYEKDLQRMIPRTLNVNPDSPAGFELAKRIQKFYFHNEPIDVSKLHEIGMLHTDYHFAIHTILTAEQHANIQQNAPLYFYRFSFDGDFNFYKKIFLSTFEKDKRNLPGACHADDIFYLFNFRLLKDNRDENSKSSQVSKTMCLLWTNFAKYGEPTPSKAHDVPFKWNPVKHKSTYSEIDYLEIGETIEMKTGPDQKRMEFWKNEYNQWNAGSLKPKL